MPTVTAPRADKTSDLTFAKVRTPSDLLQFEIEEHQLDWFVPLPDIADELTAHRDRLGFVLQAGGEKVGFFVVTRDLRDRSCWWLSYFLLDRRRQGRGYGTAAFRAILTYLANREGCRRIRLQVTPGNDKARALYLRAGFEETGLAAGDGDDILELALDAGTGWVAGDEAGSLLSVAHRTGRSLGHHRDRGVPTRHLPGRRRAETLATAGPPLQ